MNLRVSLIIPVLVFSALSSGCDASVSVADNATIGNSNSNSNIPANDAPLIPSTPFIAEEADVVSQLNARHRSGQTFLTWPETSQTARYNIYRHSQPITTNTLPSATLLNRRWGSLGPDTSVNRYATADVPANFVIEDLSAPLSSDTGLFVYTIPEGEQAQAYYAVTSIVNGLENTRIVPGVNSLASPVQEASATPIPILTSSINEGKGRIYTQYMDYSNWNPTFNGYAYSYVVTLPHNYDPSRQYPLQLYLHAYGSGYQLLPQTEYDWEFIKVVPSDLGSAQNTTHTWWYGFAADHNYETNGSIPATGVIENFTEQRVLAAVREVVNNNGINVNPELIHVIGNSMGASGALALGMRYPDVFAGIYASQPMTNYSTSPLFQRDFAQVWGERANNLPIVNAGPDSGSISDYDINGRSPTRVWNWMNHFEQLIRRSGDSFSYLMVDHGKADGTIDWNTQGQPLSRILTEAKVGFSANAYENVGHSWQAFGAVVTSMFGLGFSDNAPWKYPNSLSFPSITNATGSSSINPGATNDSRYNINIEWSTPANAFDRNIVDTPNQYQISLRSLDAQQTASITPRNTQQFDVGPNEQCSWSVSRVSNNQLLQTGTVIADQNGLVTVDRVFILTNRGSRLRIDC